MSNFFYSQVRINDNNEKIISELELYADSRSMQVYLINKPLGDNKYSYNYEDSAFLVLIPNHKIIFFNVGDNEVLFNNYKSDFVDDIGYLSDKYEYKQYIGRPREWESELIVTQNIGEDIDIEKYLDVVLLTDGVLRRKCELIISLLVGSINDIKNVGVNEPETTLDKIKRKIVLFDGEQTRFIYKKLDKKRVNIQGLSGTGKTELLLHKLKELYTKTSDTKIFFTCHNKILSSNIKQRIPDFFNFMKVEKQIKWEERLWAVNAWGSSTNKDSGVYSYICDFYNINFNRFSRFSSFEKVCELALEEINANKAFDQIYAFDYILIDESQDFPNSFFDLCNRVTSKTIFIAGDIFQDIFDNEIEKKTVDADFVLNRCYRTDPRTLMFAQAAGMGLFEKNKLNWLGDDEWKASGYIVKKEENRVVLLSREPIRRFEELNTDDVRSMNIIVEKVQIVDKIIETINIIKKNNNTVEPDDIGIIFMDNDKNIYEIIDILALKISKRFSWSVNKAYESKEKIKKEVFVSNRNNVKGLEFPFVLCITNKILNNLRYRNTLYTMLTRSFIQSYLIVSEDDCVNELRNGLDIINSKHYVQTMQPTPEEMQKIKKSIIKFKQEDSVSYKDFLSGIFNELKIDSRFRKKFERLLAEFEDDKFNRDKVKDFIEVNRQFVCKSGLCQCLA